MPKGGGGGPELPPDGLFQGWWLPEGGGPLLRLGGGGTGELMSGLGALGLPEFHGDIPPP